MTSMNLLEVIGAVRDRYILDALGNQKPQRKRLSLNRSLLIAAIIALMLLLVGCTIAVVMRIQDAKIGQNKRTYYAWETTRTSDVISLQGFAGTPNYQAAKEWYDFLETYDPDQTLLYNEDYFEPMEYMSYQCYTQEMQDKIDQICAKYDLELLGPVYLPDTPEQTLSDLGISSIANNAAQVSIQSSYYYQDGTFSFDGNLTLTGGTVNFQYRCVMKTAFDGVFLSVGDIESYDQWNRVLPDGTQALLALSQQKALLLVDKGTCFITVNILDSSNVQRQIDRAALEAIADSLCFSFTPQRPDPEALPDPPEWFPSSDTSADTSVFVCNSYQEVVANLLDTPVWPYEVYYALYDLDGNGIDELLIGEGGSFGTILTMRDGKTLPIEHFSGTSDLYLCEDGILEWEAFEPTFNPTIERHFYYHVAEADAMIFDSIIHTEDKYLRSDDGGTSVFGWRTITEAEYNAVRSQYARIELEWKPLSQFPADITINTTVPSSDHTPEASTAPAEPGYDEVISYYAENFPGQDIRYCLNDFDGDGYDDIAIWYDGMYRNIYMMNEGTVKHRWEREDGFTICETYMQHVFQVAYEGNILHIQEEKHGVEYHTYLLTLNSGTYVRECIRYDPNGGNLKWAKAVVEPLSTIYFVDLGNLETWEALTEQEYNERIADYQEMPLELKPISEYSMG